MRRLTYIILAICVCAAADRLCRVKGGFVKLSSSTLEEIPPDVQKILEQPFSYLGKGSQSAVFLSEDHKYVVKFFKREKLSAKSCLAYIPLPFNPYYKDLVFKRQKHQETLASCKTAYEELKEETALVYLHLHPSPSQKMLKATGKKGELCAIPLHDTLFIVQKKAELIYPTINLLMHQGKKKQAKEAICAVFDLLDLLGKKGVGRNDPIIKKNFALLDGKAVQIDIGKLQIEQVRLERQSIYKTELANIMGSFKVWLEQNHPELVPYFEEKLQSLL